MKFCTVLAVSLLSCGLAAQPNYTVTPIGPGCGPTLAASFRPVGEHQKLVLSLSGAWAKSHSLTYFGVDNIVYPFANGCTLYTIPIWQHPAMISDLGEYTWSRAWPTWVLGYFNLQTAVFRFDKFGNLADFQLSNAVRVEHN